MNGVGHSSLENKLEDFDYVIDSDYAEILYTRGVIDLNSEQLSQIVSQDFISLNESQFLKIPGNTSTKVYEWIEPLQAVHILSPTCAGDANAKSMIAERLLDGAISCTFVWSCQSIDFGKVPTKRPRVSSEPLTPSTAFSVVPAIPSRSVQMLGGAFRFFSDDWKRDQQRWDWQTGTFCGAQKNAVTISQTSHSGEVISQKKPLLFVIHGVRFNKPDIDRIKLPGRTLNELYTNNTKNEESVDFTNRSFGNEQRVRVTRRGRKRLPDWDVWFAELLVYTKTHGLSSRMGAEELHGIICDRIAKRDKGQRWLDFSTVQEAISTIKRRWNEAVNEGEIKKK